MSPLKRVYHFTSPDHAIENLQNQQLKVSRFSRCNDPYELAAFNQRNAAFRRRFREWLSQMDKCNGLLCFCRGWRNPVMWSHYAAHHTGLCFGFDVDPSIFADVRYVSERLYPNLTLDNFFEHVGEEQMTDLFATKFLHWSYEEEVRLLVTFSEQVATNKLIFHPFSEKLKLRQVIIGPKSAISFKEIESSLADKSVEIFKSRLAFQRFEVVRQNDRSRW